MPGASRVGVDSAGGIIVGNLAPSVITNGSPAAVLGAEVAPHDKHPHDVAVMIEASPTVFACGIPRCRAGDAASCGHRATGSNNVILNESGWLGDWAVTRARLAIDGAGAPDDCQKRLPHVVDIMREMGWEDGARLLARWFKAPASTDAEAALRDYVRLDWVLGFERARDEYDALLANALNPAAVSVLRQRLKNTTPGAFDFTKNVDCIERNHHNSRAIDGIIQPMDGLTAALGRFVFYMAAQGEKLASGDINVHGIAIAIRDSFDFEGFQPLGHWDFNHRTVEYIGRGCNLFNSDFRDWRARYGRGGDFIVESDIKRHPINQVV